MARHSPEEVGNEKRQDWERVARRETAGQDRKWLGGNVGLKKISLCRCVLPPLFLMSMSRSRSSLLLLPLWPLFCGWHHPILLPSSPHSSMPYPTGKLEHWSCLPLDSEHNEYLSWKMHAYSRNTSWLSHSPQPLNATFDKRSPHELHITISCLF